MQYTVEQRTFIVKNYLQHKSIARVEESFREKFLQLPPCRSSILRMVKKFEENGNVLNRLHNRQATISTQENTNRVSDIISENPRISIPRIASTLEIGKSSAYKIVRKILKLHPYKIQIVQKLYENDKFNRTNFAINFLHYLDHENYILNNIWFSDEAHFYLTGYVNKQNQRIWSLENPRELHETSLFPQKITVWCALSSKGIIEVILHQNVTSQSYITLLENDFIPALIGIGDNCLNEDWFMQDGARPHTANVVLDYLNEFFGNRIISNRYPERFNSGFNWPPRSPDLNPCDFFLWGYLKDRVYVNNPRNLNELEQAITETIGTITTNMLINVINAVPRRLQKVLENGGGHIEH